MKLSAITSPVV